jgi:hypothetical protein
LADYRSAQPPGLSLTMVKGDFGTTGGGGAMATGADRAI